MPFGQENHGEKAVEEEPARKYKESVLKAVFVYFYSVHYCWSHLQWYLLRILTGFVNDGVSNTKSVIISLSSTVHAISLSAL